MAWLFGTTGAGATGTTASGAVASEVAAANAATAPAAVGGIGSGLTGVGGGTFSGLGSTAPMTIGAGTPGLALDGIGSMAPYGAPVSSLGGLGSSVTPSLATGVGSFTGGASGTLPSALMSNQIFQPTLVQRAQGAAASLVPGQQDIIDGLLTGLTLSGAPAPPPGSADRIVQPQQLPGQVGAMPSQQNRGRMGFNANGILSWLPQTPQVPQAPQIPGQLPPVGMMKG